MRVCIIKSIFLSAKKLMCHAIGIEGCKIEVPHLIPIELNLYI